MILNKCKNGLCAVVLLILVAGCVSTSTPPDLPHSAASPWLSQPFSASGKLALRYPKCPEYRQCTQEAVSAGLNWDHRQLIDRIALYDPTGQEALSLLYRDGAVEIHPQDGEIRTLSEEELAAEFGFRLPLAQMRQWLFIPRETPEFDEHGWHVALEDWQDGSYHRITLTRPDYYLRVLIRQLNMVE